MEEETVRALQTATDRGGAAQTGRSRSPAQQNCWLQEAGGGAEDAGAPHQDHSGPIICGRDREGPTGDRWDQDLHIFQPACPALPQPGEQGYEGDEPRSRLPRRAKVGSAGETWGQFVLEAQGAPTSLLEAKRHGRLVQKSQGKEPWRPKGEGDQWRSSGKGGDGSYLKAPLSLLIDSRVYNRL